MKELVVISGKGGTGKTSITAAFAALAKNSVLADCDVDAADLHLILSPEIKQTKDFYSGYEAIVKQDECVGCGVCINICRFEAIYKSNKGTYYIDILNCEGCGVCQYFCPVKAINLKERLCGKLYVSNTRFGPMVHAKLGIAAENSGKLVSMVRNTAKEIAKEKISDLLIVDGPPGIGCPVIASITGSDAVVIVTEPTLSGKHDLERVIELTKHFKIPVFICVNKWDINTEITESIENGSVKNGATILGRISYDREITMAQIAGKSVIEWNKGIAQEEIKKIWKNLHSKI